MKQCPHCKRNIPDSAKICPYCGHVLEKGYQPMKRTNSLSNLMYISLAVFLIISPLISTLLFGNLVDEYETSETTIRTPKDTITLGPLQTIDPDKEENLYYFSTLSDFNKLVTNSDKYVAKIKKLETDLNKIISKYSDAKIDKEYSFYVTSLNNVYTDLVYSLSDDAIQLTVSLSYDLSGETNAVEINQNVGGLENFAALKINADSYPLAKEIITLINGDKKYQNFNDAGKKFNKLEAEFNERASNLGNYGIAASQTSKDAKTSMRVLTGKDGYRFKLTCKIKADLDKLV